MAGRKIELSPEALSRRQAAVSATRRLVADREELANLLPTSMGATRRTLCLKRLREMPVSCRNTYLRAILGKSIRAGAKAFCSMCMGWQEFQNGIRNCTDLACPLLPYRPFQEAKL